MLMLNDQAWCVNSFPLRAASLEGLLGKEMGQVHKPQHYLDGKKNAYGCRVVKQKVADTCLPSIFFSLKQNLGFFGRPVSARIYCRYTDPLFQGWTLIVYPTLLAAVIVSEAVI